MKHVTRNTKKGFTQLYFFAKKSSAGFTIIETFVAITILLVGIAGPLTLISRGVASSAFAKQQITATYLAQEVVEFVHNKRHSNLLEGEGTDWMDGLGPCRSGRTCRIDVREVNEIAECLGTCTKLQHNTDNGAYGYESGLGWQDSAYTRSITIADTSGAEVDEVVVTVSVSWSGGLVPSKTITVREHLFNWQ